MWLAFKRVAPIAFLGVLPLILLVIGALKTLHDGDLGVDFRHELYPEAKLVLHGTNPFPSRHADLSGGVNRIFTIPAALLVAPLTPLPPGAAAAVVAAILLGMVAATLRVLRVSDWRVYGTVLLWPPTIAAIQTGNLSIPLGLLVAVAWRYRERQVVSGLAIGASAGLKLFLWPLFAWLVARRRYRAAAAGAAVALACVLLVLPFESLSSYVAMMNHLGDTFAPESYNLVGLLVQSGAAGLAAAKLVADGAGLLVLALAYRRRSLPLSIAASFLLSPIVWLHYFVLLLVPLAIASPGLSVAWFLPLALWGCPGNGGDVRERHVVIGLAVLAAVTVIAEWGPRSLTRGRVSVAAPVRS